MGKLHSLRRAILRNPDAWKKEKEQWVRTTAVKIGNKWIPQKYFWGKKSYNRFIESVLKSLPGA